MKDRACIFARLGIYYAGLECLLCRYGQAEQEGDYGRNVALHTAKVRICKEICKKKGENLIMPPRRHAFRLWDS